MNKRAQIKISGSVQGVSYRYFTKQKADQLGLTGWVCNLPDGRVAVLAEGPVAKIKVLIKWLAEESPGQTEKIITQWTTGSSQFPQFSIR